MRSGGAAVCALGETVNCATVWNSAFASRLHGLFGMPVAALGLVWGLAAFALTVRVMVHALGGRPLARPVVAVRLVAAVGALSCITFAMGSFKAGAVCLTCLTTFALVAAFAAVSFLKLPGALSPSAEELRSAALWAGAFTAVAFALLLKPGLDTPRAGGTGLTQNLTSPQTPSEDGQVAKVKGFLQGLPWAEKQAVSDSLAEYKRSPTPDLSRFLTRFKYGPDDAPVKVVEFTDVRCSHCRMLEQMMRELKSVVPASALSVEPRHFPLDGECNPLIARVDGAGVSCLGAKAQVCLEGAPDFWELREKLFAEQESLTKERILEIASSGSLSRQALDACLARPETQKKVADDVAFAALYSPEGTPLVVVNGRKGSPSIPWLYAMAMTGGDPNSKVFADLPPPR